MSHYRPIDRFFILLICVIFTYPVFSQLELTNYAPEQIRQLDVKHEISIFNKVSSKELKNTKAKQLLSEYNLLTLKSENLINLIASKSESISLEIPIGISSKMISLEKVNILAPGFKVRKASNPQEELNVDLGLVYRGKVSGDDNSMATISFNGKEVNGLITVEGHTFNLGKLKDENYHIIYKEKDLDYQNNFACHTDIEQQIGKSQLLNKQLKNSAVDNCVSVYVETQYDMYQERGSVTSVTNFITSLFAQVSTIYANESINLLLGELFVWDVNDPYTGNSPSTLLNQFMDRLDGDFNGDIAHLINFEQNGGIAYVDALCSSFAYGTSGIDNFFSNVPTYSWSVGILAHEIGHNLGSPHTHACVWNGNNTAIDGCGDDGGNCNTGPIPSSGTIMSYCHLLSNVGIDFSLGFGPQPGDLIRSVVNSASCLQVCGDCDNQGDSCDDGDPCTINDQINAACNCTGTYVDEDLDGICSEEDPDDNDPCIPEACPTCTTVTITVVLDRRPAETSWEIRGASGNVLITSGSGYGSFPRGTTVRSRLCVSDACYTFVMKDAWGDGLCCGQGEGSYSVTLDDGTVLASGGEFGDEDLTDFCINSNIEECSDDTCDDGDPCTINDRYDDECECLGTPKVDTDNDGICDDEDSCPNLRNNLIGTSCEDGDPCTTGETYNRNCGCTGGSYVDNDNDGVCVGEDPDDDDPCVPNTCDGGCVDVTVTITLDNYPGETNWKITNQRGQTQLENPRYHTRDRGTTISTSVCLDPGCFEFRITDSYGDGICCLEGDGSYTVTLSDGSLVASGGEFSRNETKEFCINSSSGDTECSGPCDDGDPCTNNDQYNAQCDCAGVALPDSDNDGICDAEDDCPNLKDNLIGKSCDDGDDCTTGEKYSADSCECEGGQFIDKDGDGYCLAEDPDDSDPCNPDTAGGDCSGELNCNTESESDFEDGLDGWTSGGSDAVRSRFQQYSSSGEYCIRLRDNTDESVLTSSRLRIGNVRELNVEFSYYALSMDNSSEDFWLQLSTDGGNTFTTVEEWNKNDEFNNNKRYTGVANIKGPFTNNTYLRFRCDASNNADIVFIDDIKVESCNGSSASVANSSKQNELENYLNFKVFPNPVSQQESLNINVETLEDEVNLTMYDLLGKQIGTKVIAKKNYYKTSINTAEIKSGTYFIKIDSETNSKIKKVIVIH